MAGSEESSTIAANRSQKDCHWVSSPLNFGNSRRGSLTLEHADTAELLSLSFDDWLFNTAALSKSANFWAACILAVFAALRKLSALFKSASNKSGSLISSSTSACTLSKVAKRLSNSCTASSSCTLVALGSARRSCNALAARVVHPRAAARFLSSCSMSLGIFANHRESLL